MPFPLLGIVARSILGGVGSGLGSKAISPKFTVSLSEGGAGIKRKVRAIGKRTRRAALLATNATGKVVRVEAREALAGVFDVSPATVRKVEKAQAAFRGSKRPAYTVYYRQTRMPVQRVRSIKFRRGRGGPGARGTLTFRLWRGGRRIVLRGVVKRGRGYILAATRRLPERAVGGPRVSPRSRPVRLALNPIRKGLRKRFRREFKRQHKIVARGK